MKNLMIDIETMGTHSSESLILSVGALPFSLLRDQPVFGDEIFLKVLTIEPQLLRGRRIEPETQKWWLNQTQAARNHWEIPTVRTHPQNLHFEITQFLETNCEGPHTLIWANGIVFDIGNLENLIQSFNNSPPWRYNVVRDARTMYQLPQVRSMPGSLVFEGHDPVEDCKKQIWRLWEHATEEMFV